MAWCVRARRAMNPSPGASSAHTGRYGTSTRPQWPGSGNVLRVFISPNYLDAPPNADNGGIKRVVEAEIRHLPAFDVQVVRRAQDADVIQNHGSMLTYAPGIPIVHTGHGFMCTRQPRGDGMQEVNRLVVESMARAVAWTAPSEWVNRAIRRGGYWYPETVYHGVETGDFTVWDDHENFVLWNKARSDYDSNPYDIH